MINIGSSTLGQVPRVALAAGDFSQELAGAHQSGASILEVRLDWFSKSDPPFIQTQLQAYRALKMPLLATIRSASEGGKWAGSEASRLQAFLQAIPLADAIDVEWSATEINAQVAGACKAAGKALILSLHDFEKTPAPAQLDRFAAEARALGADIIKLACQADAPQDVAGFLKFVVENRSQGVVGICMGGSGAVSRLAAPWFGSLLTYTSLQPVYGQLPLPELVRQLRALYPAFDAQFSGSSFRG